MQIHNPSTLVVRTRLACNFRVYGERVTAGPLCDGEDVWLLFPQQTSQGWFDIDALLQRKGKGIAEVIAECTPANRREQLTMLLQLEFCGELGARRKLPSRPHYVDFERGAWIPELAEQVQRQYWVSRREMSADASAERGSLGAQIHLTVHCER